VEENGNFQCMKGDEKGEYTFTRGRGNTTTDFVLGDEDVREEIEEIGLIRIIIRWK